jgi:hypothetical protein
LNNIPKRERITDELTKLDAVLDALRALSDIEPEPTAVNGSHQAAPAASGAGEDIEAPTMTAPGQRSGPRRALTAESAS